MSELNVQPSKQFENRAQKFLVDDHTVGSAYFQECVCTAAMETTKGVRENMRVQELDDTSAARL